MNDPKVGERFAYLKARWKDECGYETFEDYIIAMSKVMPKGVTLFGGSPRPFRFMVKFDSDPRTFFLFMTPRRTLALRL